MVQTLQWLTGLYSRTTPLVRGAGTAFALQVAGAGLGYGFQVLLARWMGAGGYGSYVYAMSWAGLLATFGGLGFPTATLRFVPQYAEQEKPGLLRGFLRTSRQVVFFATALITLAGVAVAWKLLPTPELERTPVLIGLGLAPVLALVRLETEILRARQRIAWAYGPPRVMRLLLLLGAAFLLSKALPGPLAAEHVLLLAGLALASVLLVQRWASHRALHSLFAGHASQSRLFPWVRVALPLLLVKGFLIILSQTDIFFLGALRGSETVGLYNAALRTAHITAFASVAVSAVAAPAISRQHAQGDRAALQRLSTRLAHWYFWPSLLLAGGLAVFSAPVLRLFGPAFATGQAEMLILMAGLVVNAGMGAQVPLLTLTGHERRSVQVYAGAVVLDLALTAAGVYYLGTLGAALATTAVSIGSNLWLRYLVIRHVNVRPTIAFALGFLSAELQSP